MQSIEELFPWNTIDESIIEKDWACGSKEPTTVQEYIIKEDGTAEYATVTYSPAWWKIIDEPIVNALDHFIRCLDKNEVTEIKIDFEPSGKVRIYNNGPGIPIVVHQVASKHEGADVWLPTMVIARVLQGSNKKQAADCIIGGTNGFGAKLILAYSSESVLETVHDGKYFIQRWKNNKRVEEKPVIIDLSKDKSVPKGRREPHTTISFTPDYMGQFSYKSFGPEEYAATIDIVRTRAYYAAAYVGYTCAQSNNQSKKHCSVWFNGKKIQVNSMQDIAKILFPGKEIIHTTIIPTVVGSGNYKYPWELTAVIGAPSGRTSIVNGIVVGEGKHLNKIMNILIAETEKSVSKQLGNSNIKFSPSHVTGNIFLMLNTKVPLPSWTGQRKDVLSTDMKLFSGYTVDTKTINLFTKSISNTIIDSIFNKTTTKTVKNKIADYEKYRPARDAGTKHSHLCTLIIVEGDSAVNQVITGLTKTIGVQRYGVISTGGVIINVRKECSIVETAQKHLKMSKKLTNNLFINGLINILGLNLNYTYDPDSPNWAKERKKLNYGRIAICVDQDMDGKGNILALLLSMMHKLWPKLFDKRNKFIYWFITPIVRSYPKAGTILEFFDIPKYESWAATHDVDDFTISYYKGIGSHNPDETENMFKKFESNLYLYYLDEKSNEYFEIYLGDKPDLRKIELRKPIPVIPPEVIEQQFATKMISCTHQLIKDTDEYQRDNLDRKLDHVIDGQNQAGRKILDGIMKECGSKKITVEKLAGPISEKENYHHGGASLCSSIQGKAFLATGGKQLPFLLPFGQLGSRLCGGDAASSRYTSVLLNRKLVSALFPAADYHILEFKFDEGSRSEPKYFVPVIPLAICESTELPAHGWKLELWARDVYSVIDNVRRLIAYGSVPLLDMPPCTYKGNKFEWKGEFRTIRGKYCSVGKYYIEDNTIVIYELPLRVWTNTYVSNLKKKAASYPNLIEHIDQGVSNDIIVDIRIKLLPGAINTIETYGDSYYTDGVEEFFNLTNSMKSHINLMDTTGGVIECNGYSDVLTKWFPVRRDLYSARIDRMVILIELKIKRMENIIRYIQEYKTLKIPNKKKTEMINILATNKFDKMNNTLLKSPGFTPTNELDSAIMNSVDSKYDYLLLLNDFDKSQEGLQDYINKLAKLRIERNDLQTMANQGMFRGAVLFEQELNALEKIIKDGFRTNWEFENAGKHKFS